MRQRLGLRIAIVAVVILGSLAYLYPPPFLRTWLYGSGVSARVHVLMPSTINLGLDLQGGIHLVLGVDLDKAIESQTERAVSSVRGALDKKGIAVTRVQRRGISDIEVQLASPQSWGAAQTAVSELSNFEVKEPDQAAGRFILAMRPREVSTLKDLSVRQALETIRNRVDQFGVAEPSIQQQGENRILVQLPGVQEPERAKALIGKTALLEFKLVDERADAERAARENVVPEGDELLMQRRVDKQTREERRIPYVVGKKAVLTGADLSTARVSIDQNTGEPYVSVEFNPAGARVFSELTEANVGKRLAIVLDGNVHSAPVMRERIFPGQAQISCGLS